MTLLARAVRGLALSVVLAFAGAPAALAAPTFPELTGRVVDGADILSPQAETQLTGPRPAQAACVVAAVLMSSRCREALCAAAIVDGAAGLLHATQ